MKLVNEGVGLSVYSGHCDDGSLLLRARRGAFLDAGLTDGASAGDWLALERFVCIAARCFADAFYNSSSELLFERDLSAMLS
jgi:hypothetical protein